MCVSSWIWAACWKDSVGMLTHGSCCVALSPWDMFLMLILGRVWELLSFRAGCFWADAALMGGRSSVRQQLLFVQKISERPIWHVEVKPKRCATAPTKWVFDGWVAKCFGQLDFQGWTICDCGLGLQNQNFLESQHSCVWELIHNNPPTLPLLWAMESKFLHCWLLCFNK